MFRMKLLLAPSVLRHFVELESGFHITAEIWETLVLRGGNFRKNWGEERMRKKNVGCI